eukprot:41754-Eustigmatos_ZCMA.PRE.1
MRKDGHCAAYQLSGRVIIHIRHRDRNILRCDNTGTEESQRQENRNSSLGCCDKCEPLRT